MKKSGIRYLLKKYPIFQAFLKFGTELTLNGNSIQNFRASYVPFYNLVPYICTDELGSDLPMHTFRIWSIRMLILTLCHMVDLKANFARSMHNIVKNGDLYFTSNSSNKCNVPADQHLTFKYAWSIIIYVKEPKYVFEKTWFIFPKSKLSCCLAGTSQGIIGDCRHKINF